MLDFEDALARLLAGAAPLTEMQSVPTQSAAGRILAQGLRSAIDVPPLDNTSMDGYALRCADVPAAGTQLVVVQRIAAGSVGHALARGTAARIFTGAPLPAGADAVVMQELCVVDGDTVTVNQVPRVGEWIRRRGEDIAAGSEVLAAGTRLSAAHLGVAASVGAASLTVFRRLRVALFSTGDELAMPGEALKPGGIYNSNRYTLRALLEGLGCEVADFGIVPDQREATRAVLRIAAAGNDLILTSGGVSVGEEDHVKPAVEAEGVLDLWKIAIKPGKPLAFGSVRRTDGAASFIGLPGNPVSSFVTFVMLVRPFILKAQGASAVMPRAQQLRADFECKGDPRREFLRARINPEGGLELFAN
ncbi:MAG: molybdopterin molybdotransferase MoeA, partial [Rhodocyclaceae bacterium]|nr:molybdopterin molybdotransferase MoeA [Rhodocyclaceae bacterium]